MLLLLLFNPSATVFNPISPLPGPEPLPPSGPRFRMVGRDENSSPTHFRSWVVNGQPDFPAALYGGLKSGINPLLDVKAYEIFDPTSPFDFSLPDVLNWNTTKRVLPAVISNSQLAIMDGYVWLFGSQNSAKIWRAPLNNPADWTDTGATLPKNISDSQLAVIDGYVWLFGGLTDGYTGSETDEIFSAPISNPLSWTNRGHALPKPLSASQLVIVDGYMYMLGGRLNSGPYDGIWQAPITNPLIWTDTGKKLPNKVFNSQVCITRSDGYVELLGGQLDGYHFTDLIYYASVFNPTSWAVAGRLPAQCAGGQFAQIAGKGYLFTPANIGASNTRIFRCDFGTNPFAWVDVVNTIPGEISQSQIAIIDDRLFLFGGSGSSVIFASDQIIKYQFASPAALQYGFITRTQVLGIGNANNLFKVLSMQPWKTGYLDF